MSTFSEAVGGLGEPFEYQAGPFVTRPTAIYEHSQSSFGEEDALLAAPPQTNAGAKPMEGLRTAGYLIGVASGMAGAYHGYKRNESIGWAIGWGILGSLFWPIAVPIMVAQGFGKPAQGK